MQAPSHPAALAEPAARVRGYLIAAAALVVALGIRALLDPWLGDQRPLSVLHGAIAAAAWFGGLGPAVFACVVGYLACDWAFIPPRGEFGFGTSPDAFGALMYALASSIIVALSVVARRSRRRAGAEAEDRGHWKAAPFSCQRAWRPASFSKNLARLQWVRAPASHRCDNGASPPAESCP